MTGDGGYGAGYGTGYDPVSGVGFVGEDWQSYDWNKLAQNDPKAWLIDKFNHSFIQRYFKNTEFSLILIILPKLNET